eukprot:364099_1
MAWLVLVLWMAIPVVHASTTVRPNIVLLFPDQWRFDFMNNGLSDISLQLRIPTIDEIVRNGTRFVHAIVASPICAPSRSCLAAGKEYDYAGVPSNTAFPENQSTIYNLLSDNGYWVMTAGKDDLFKGHGCGKDGRYRQKELGFNAQRRCKGKQGVISPYPRPNDPYSVYLQRHIYNGTNQTEFDILYQYFQSFGEHDRLGHVCREPIALPDASYQDNWITDQTLEMLGEAPTNMPWFLQVNWAGPHPPFFITQSMEKSAQNRKLPNAMHAAHSNYNLNVDDVMLARRNYVAQIENLDTQIAKVIDKLRDLGEYDNTLFCFSSDHGEMLGDFGVWCKGKPWVSSTNVPLVCMGPGVKRNNIIYKYVTNMDMAATFLDYANTKLNSDMTIVSLRPFLDGAWTDQQNEYRNHVLSGYRHWRMVVQHVNASVIWKFICCQGKCRGEGTRELAKYNLLFNVVEDLYEEHNVGELYPDIMNQLRSLIPRNFCNNSVISDENESLNDVTDNVVANVKFIQTAGNWELIVTGLAAVCVIIYIYFHRNNPTKIRVSFFLFVGFYFANFCFHVLFYL